MSPDSPRRFVPLLSPFQSAGAVLQSRQSAPTLVSTIAISHPVSGRIPQHFIDELIARADIVELIGSRVPLKKQGKEFKACCPFHGEKTPSFTVVPTSSSITASVAARTARRSGS